MNMSSNNYTANANSQIEKYNKAIKLIDESLVLLNDALAYEKKIKGFSKGKQLEADILNKIEQLKQDKNKLNSQIIMVREASKRLQDEEDAKGDSE